MRNLLWSMVVILPKNITSRIFGWLAERRWPVFSRLFKGIFVFIYKIDLAEAEKEPREYQTLQQLFIRQLKTGARSIADAPLVSPVDGRLDQWGALSLPNLQLIQAKGKYYSLEKLIGSGEIAQKFEGGMWATIYLAPYNYHRIHSPVSGTILETLYIPGQLWPVNSMSVERIDQLFCINERVSTRIRTDKGGECLVVKVGATNVGRITLSYTDLIASNTQSAFVPRKPLKWQPHEPIEVKKGEELGIFQLGSTVVVIADQTLVNLTTRLFSGYQHHEVKMGQALCQGDGCSQ